MRVKIIKANRNYKKGEVVEVSPNVGFGLIDSGVGIMTKEITEMETKLKRKESKK